MNIVLRKPDSEEYYVVYTQESIRGGFFCGAKVVSFCKESESPSHMAYCEQNFFKTKEDSAKRCRSRAKTKMRKRGCVRVEFEDIPEKLFPGVELPLDMNINEKELIEKAREAKRERYVIFSDVSGMENFFEVGGEYLAHEKSDGFLSVYDRFGECRECFADRMKSITPTERTKEIERVFNG